MQAPRTNPGTDVIIRAAGALLLVAAWAFGSALFASRPELAISGPRAIHFALAAATYLASTSGAACLLIGRHLLDRVTVARPWGSGDIAYLRPDE